MNSYLVPNNRVRRPMWIYCLFRTIRPRPFNNNTDSTLCSVFWDDFLVRICSCYGPSLSRVTSAFLRIRNSASSPFRFWTNQTTNWALFVILSHLTSSSHLMFNNRSRYQSRLSLVRVLLAHSEELLRFIGRQRRSTFSSIQFTSFKGKHTWHSDTTG
jgi:hypothetical protein